MVNNKVCKFFSVVSNGKGKVLHFTLEQIQKIQRDGNPENYNWNSHTSIMHFNNIKGQQEDKWNKWEYDCEQRKLILDGDLNTKKNDEDSVKFVVEKYLTDNNAIYIQKIFKNNSGYRNSGYRNSGNSNSGNWNSGDSNSGDRNSGKLNTTQPLLRIFNKPTKVENIIYPQYFYFELNEWVNISSMTDKEKENFNWYKTTGGYLKKIDYKEAWIKSFNETTKKDVELTLNLPNFKYKLFEEISGITKKMIQNKIRGV